ncbi:MAG: MlaD family protein, partial [Planctomycetota bacterium]
MSQPRHSFLVGLTSIVGTLGLATLLMLFGEFDRYLIPGYEVEVAIDHAAGLRKGSTVVLNGVRIGQVSLVELQPDPEFPVRIVARIEEGNLIPEDAAVEIDQALIGGSSVLSLDARTPGVTPFPTDGSARLTAKSRSILEVLNDALADRFEPLMNAMESFDRLSSSFEQVGNRLDDLLAP